MATVLCPVQQQQGIADARAWPGLAFTTLSHTRSRRLLL
jgi:hypothetical protein